jgi:hypothetical protein
MLLALATGPSGLLPLGVVLLAVAGALQWRRRTRGEAGPAVKTVRLTAQHALHVVEIDGRRLVVGTAPGAAPSLVDAGPVPTAAPPEPAWIHP